MLTNNLVLLVSKKQIYYISVLINIFDEIKTKNIDNQVYYDFLRMVKILEDAIYYIKIHKESYLNYIKNY